MGHILPLAQLDPEVGCLLEPLACTVHAASLLDVEEGTPALVVGAGPMGILAMWALQARGAQVAVCETSESRRRTVADLGAQAVLGPDDDLGDAFGASPLAAIVTAPGPAPLTWALERMDAGGAVHAFAGTPGGNPIDANLVHYRQLRMVGSTGSSRRDYRAAHELVSSGRVPLDRLPRRIVSLETAAQSLRTPDAAPDRRSVIGIGRS